jgi:hypothetical protein
MTLSMVGKWTSLAEEQRPSQQAATPPFVAAE